MNIFHLTSYLERNFLIRPYAADLVVYEKDGKSDLGKRIAIIHCRAGEIVWTIEYSDRGEMKKDFAPNVELACLKFLVGHLERYVEQLQGDLFNSMMKDFKTELTDEELSSGPAPQKFIATHRVGTEIKYAIWEAGNPSPLHIFDEEDEAEKKLKEYDNV